MIGIHYGRNLKGIKQELNKKITDWIKSIDDNDVKSIASKNTIVTGGCIASMLLGEKVNDFDIYFKTIEATEEIAKYYVKKFNKENNHEIEVSREYIENIKKQTEERVILRIKSSGIAEEENNKKSTNDKYRPVFISKNAITLSNKIQLVTRFYGEADKIHDNYDFEHACCYFDFKSNELVTPEKALTSLLSRTLIYRGSLYPIASIFRAKKFIERGWRISAGQQLKMMWQISELDLKDYSVIEEQLTGVDQIYLWQLCKSLKDVYAKKIHSAYVCTIIDRIFE